MRCMGGMRLRTAYALRGTETRCSLRSGHRPRGLRTAYALRGTETFH